MISRLERDGADPRLRESLRHYGMETGSARRLDPLRQSRQGLVRLVGAERDTAGPERYQGHAPITVLNRQRLAPS